MKRISFTLLGIILLILIVATILEKIFGTGFVSTYIYGSVPFVILWFIAALTGLLYLLKRRLQKRLPVFLLHLSFLVILAGAFTTWVSGEQGTLRLGKGDTTNRFTNQKGEGVTFPFSIALNSFHIVYYTGTRAPMDFVSAITITDSDAPSVTVNGEVAMNRIFSYRGYRFYQSGYSKEGEGTVLAVSYDPYGIAITYLGYAMLLLSMFMFFFFSHSSFRRLLNSPLLQRSAAFCLLCFYIIGAVQAATVSSRTDTPKVLPKELAAGFGDLYVLYNDRICPLQTLAKDFTVKLYGSPTYRGLSAEQVFTGWMFYYTSWKSEPVIKIKSAAVRRILGVKGKYASLEDYTNEINERKLDVVPREMESGGEVSDKRGMDEAEEKFGLIAMLYSGKMVKIFPHRSADNQSLEWYAQSDELPSDMDNDKWVFIRKSMDYVNEMVVKKDYEGIYRLLAKLKEYQRKEAGDTLPANLKFDAEKLYNRLDYNRILAVTCILLGLFSFIYYCSRMLRAQSVKHSTGVVLNTFLIIILFYLAAIIGLRGYVSNHLPLSNGFETMQFMAFCSLLLTLVLKKRFLMSVPFGFLLCGLTLMVSMFGESNPRITQLMPVLASPLLCIHVVVIMIAYSLLAFVMLNGITALVIHFLGRDGGIQIERLCVISRLILYPAVFLLAAGIFIGAVWANVSWGRYWGWDPKEVWALITLLIYALALHPDSLPWFHRPLFFHVFSIVAFLSVLITYFGVNFLLGGMHSYAG
ncbi:cytochrome c biogenesis protein CcsA [Bacteroides sp.]